MVEPFDKEFIEEMCGKLSEQLSRFELAKKRKEHDARIVADEGWKKWLELNECVNKHIEGINDRLSGELLFYIPGASPNELNIRHELIGRDMQIAFDPASAVISYKGETVKGEFRPRVRGDAL
jgi:hypothetical protein